VPLKNANSGPLPSEDKLEESERAYDRMVRRLTEDERMAVADVALDRMPIWLRREFVSRQLRDEDLVERAALLSGLTALAA
jgi:hypothetical protein